MARVESAVATVKVKGKAIPVQIERSKGMDSFRNNTSNWEGKNTLYKSEELLFSAEATGAAAVQRSSHRTGNHSG